MYNLRQTQPYGQNANTAMRNYNGMDQRAMPQYTQQQQQQDPFTSYASAYQQQKTMGDGFNNLVDGFKWYNERNWNPAAYDGQYGDMMKSFVKQIPMKDINGNLISDKARYEYTSQLGKDGFKYNGNLAGSKSPILGNSELGEVIDIKTFNQPNGGTLANATQQGAQQIAQQGTQQLVNQGAQQLAGQGMNLANAGLNTANATVNGGVLVGSTPTTVASIGGNTVGATIGGTGTAVGTTGATLGAETAAAGTTGATAGAAAAMPWVAGVLGVYGLGRWFDWW